MCVSERQIHSEDWIKKKRKAKRSRYHLTLRQKPIQLGTSRADYIICGTQCKMKMQGLLFKKLGKECCKGTKI